jgi:dihydroorotase
MTPAPTRLDLRRPDDWHVHLRDGALLRAVLPFTALCFGRGLIMPNLKPPVTTSAAARAYRDRIIAALPPGSGFQPLMACYLTDETDPDDLERGREAGVFAAAKLYPAGATTNSAAGVTDPARITPVLARMERIGLPLLVHGEVTDPGVDIFDREAVFLDRVLTPLIRDFPGLKLVLEHATTAEAIAFVRAHAASRPIAATLTAHHLLINRSDIFAGGLRPHLYCLPVAKRESHRRALVDAATSGEPWFFLGTDTAPHPVTAKESACGCAGIFTAPAALELYAGVFEAAGALDRLEAFASLNGAAFHGLAPNPDHITLEQAPMAVPEIVPTDDGDAVLPFRGGETLAWRIRDRTGPSVFHRTMASPV